MNQKTNPYAGHRYPIEIISQAVWLYFRFMRRFRDVEEILAYRGVIVTYEAIGSVALAGATTGSLSYALNEHYPENLHD